MQGLLKVLRRQVHRRNNVRLRIAAQAGLEHMRQLGAAVGDVVLALGMLWSLGQVLAVIVTICVLLLVSQGCDGVTQHQQAMIDLGGLLLPAHALSDLSCLPDPHRPAWASGYHR